jgi:RNA polymerase sigma factor (sigma-70 family)
MIEPESDFAELIARVRLDDDQALATLIPLYEPKIRRAAELLLGSALRSSIDPMDLVQAVHLRLIRVLKQERHVIAGPEHLREFAATILRHQFIQHWRRNRCAARHAASLAEATERSVARVRRLAAAVDPARTAELNDTLEHVYRRLRTEDRRLIVMRMQGYRTEEIAGELGTSPAVLRVRLSRIRARLRKEQPLIEWI